MLRNYMEVVVDNLLPSVLYKYENICKCEKCLEDIKAITLNSLNPLYIASEKGYVYTKINELEAQFNTDVIREVMHSIGIVSNNPRHN